MSQNISLIVTSGDRISTYFLSKLKCSTTSQTFYVVKDDSTNFLKINKLIRKKKLTIPSIFRMAISQIKFSPKNAIDFGFSIKSNIDLQAVINLTKPKNIYLFRCSIIINSETLKICPNIYNIHCARIPKYGGLNAISRALKERDFKQQASLYKISKIIDVGEVFDKEDYELNPKLNYHENEKIAYSAGIKLLSRHI